MRALAAVGAIVALGAGVAMAQMHKSEMQKVELPQQLKWGGVPPGLPGGAQLAVLAGDPANKGLFTIRIHAPDGYRVLPHSHPTDEDITVLKGTLVMGHGAEFSLASAEPVPAGGFGRIPAGSNHFVQARGDTIIQISSMGPFQINYVHPSDDPRHNQSKR
jgi:quercetin dioxygenase-like cupin family protein